MTESRAEDKITEALPFNLARPPFADEPGDSGFFPGEQYLRALNFLGHLLWSRASFGVLIAEPGCGKDLVARRFLASLDERVLRAYIDQPGLAPHELLSEVLKQLGMPLEPTDRTDRRRLLEKFLKHHSSYGRICVLIVANAQTLPVRTLEELRQIALLEVDGTRVMKLILMGSPEFSRVADSPRLSMLRSGESSYFNLHPMTEDQVAAYVAHRLKAVDVPAPDALIPSTVMMELHQASYGIPAVVNDICSRALAYAAAANLPAVTPEELQQAITSLGIQTVRSSLVAARVEDEPAIDADDPEVVLTLTTQGETPRQITMRASRILIGRSELADVCIDSTYVSRYHALIVREMGRDLLIDLGSTNAVLVNGKRVLRHFLRADDLIQIGPARLTYSGRRTIEVESDPGLTVSMMAPRFTTLPDGSTVVSIGSGSTE